MGHVKGDMVQRPGSFPPAPARRGSAGLGSGACIRHLRPCVCTYLCTYLGVYRSSDELSSSFDKVSAVTRRLQRQLYRHYLTP